uniref:C-type lectin domain-containing protein n=1 Tax=Sinocyclocheilus anshuiensis TaxID=1608454 RepID=A0A671MM92_9TELE
MSGIVNDSMNKGSIMDSEDRIERTVDIYISAEEVKRLTSYLSSSGSDGVTIRSSRAAVVCLVLLCVLLLTAVIVLCVTFTQERQQILTKITNLTEERDQLLTNNMNLTEGREQLLTNNMNLTKERNQLLTNNMNLTKERNQLLTNNMNLTKERNQLLTNNMNLTKERNQLLTNNMNLTKERDLLKSEKNELQTLYFISSETKKWAESRKYCTNKGADLIIINDKEEQDFVKNISGDAKVWIGLTDQSVEGRWKWVDGFSQFWENGQTNKIEEDCALNYSPGWADFPCGNKYKWICEKSIFK